MLDEYARGCAENGRWDLALPATLQYIYSVVGLCTLRDSSVSALGLKDRYGRHFMGVPPAQADFPRLFHAGKS